jgi:hypothetical protein
MGQIRPITTDPFHCHREHSPINISEDKHTAYEIPPGDAGIVRDVGGRRAIDIAGVSDPKA